MPAISHAETDFLITLDRAAGLCQETGVAVRAAGKRPIPARHRQLVNRANRRLQAVQDDLFEARNLPFQAGIVQKPSQLSLDVAA